MKKTTKALKRIIGLSLILAFLYLSINYFHFDLLLGAIKRLLNSKESFMTIIIVYTLAFLTRTISWKLYVGINMTFRRSFFAIMYSLLVNHLLPIKVGDLVRIGIATYKTNLTIKKATESVFVMRILDLLFLGFFSGIGLIVYLGIIKITFLFLLLVLLAVVILSYVLISRFKNHSKLMNIYRSVIEGVSGIRGFVIISLIGFSWILEGIVVYKVGMLLYQPISFLQAVWVNSITVAGQIFQLTPGGLGTYEAVMSWSLISLDFDEKYAYSIAVVTHTTKFLYSYAFGFLLILIFPISVNQIRRWIKGD
jgi:uncharacterized membrane protein YbhN (UPF0104 family)